MFSSVCDFLIDFFGMISYEGCFVVCTALIVAVGVLLILVGKYKGKNYKIEYIFSCLPIFVFEIGFIYFKDFWLGLKGCGLLFLSSMAFVLVLPCLAFFCNGKRKEKKEKKFFCKDVKLFDDESTYNSANINGFVNYIERKAKENIPKTIDVSFATSLIDKVNKKGVSVLDKKRLDQIKETIENVGEELTVDQKQKVNSALAELIKLTAKYEVSNSQTAK